LVDRYGYIIRAVSVTPESKCPKCSTTIPGIWA